METIKQNCNIVLLKAENIKKRENEMKKIHSIYQIKSRAPGVSHCLSNIESNENTRCLKYSPPLQNQDLLFENDNNKTDDSQNCSIVNIKESTVFADNSDITDSDINKMQFTNYDNTTTKTECYIQPTYDKNTTTKTECCIQSTYDENMITEKIAGNKIKETSQNDMHIDDQTIDDKSLTSSQDSDDITILFPCNDLVDETNGNKEIKTDAPAKRKRGNGRRKLWKFLFELLEEDKSEECVGWTNKENGEFRMIKTSAVAALWGDSNNRKGMTYEKMARAMRYYYKLKVIKKVPRKNLHYQFGTPIMSIINVQEICCTNKELAKKKKNIKEKYTATKIEKPANTPNTNNKSCNTTIENVDIDMTEKTELIKNDLHTPCEIESITRDIENTVNNTSIKTSMKRILNHKQKLEENISDGIESDCKIIKKKIEENKLQTKRRIQSPIYFNTENNFRDLNYSQKYQIEMNKDIQRTCKTKIIYPHMISQMFSR